MYEGNGGQLINLGSSLNSDRTLAKKKNSYEETIADSHRPYIPKQLPLLQCSADDF